MRLGRSFHDVIRHNVAGIGPTDLCPDLKDFDFDAFLGGLQPASTISARHTVGLVDPITADDQATRVGDGLPETLEEVVRAYGHRWFKLKVGGDIAADIERLARIAGGARPHRRRLPRHARRQRAVRRTSTACIELWHRMRADPRLARLCRNVSFIEQPIKRQAALSQNVSGLSTQRPVIIDESDDSLDAFVQGRQMGYTGVSSKTCKGFYKSLINRARCLKWNHEESRDEVLDPTNPRYIMSAEDLTIQAGLALQQDLALVSLMGIRHVERNGHHYVNGMAGLPEAEQEAFLAAHPDLYERSHGAVRVRIRDGTLAIGSLGCTGFASGALPDWAAMRPMRLGPGSHAGRAGEAAAGTFRGRAPGILGRLGSGVVYYLPSVLVMLGLLLAWQVAVVSCSASRSTSCRRRGRRCRSCSTPTTSGPPTSSRPSMRCSAPSCCRRCSACCSRWSSSGTTCCCAR